MLLLIEKSESITIKFPNVHSGLGWEMKFDENYFVSLSLLRVGTSLRNEINRLPNYAQFI